MKHLVLTGQEILALGFPQGKAVGVAIRVVSDCFTEQQKEYAINLLKTILQRPHRFAQHEMFGDIVDSLLIVNVMKKKKSGTLAPVLETATGTPLQA